MLEYVNDARSHERKKSHIFALINFQMLLPQNIENVGLGGYNYSASVQHLLVKQDSICWSC